MTAKFPIADLFTSSLRQDPVPDWRAFAAALPGIVWRADADGDIEYLSPAWSAETGLSIEESRGQAWLMALHPDDRRGAGAAQVRALACGQAYQFECRLKTKGGGYRRQQWRGCPLRDSLGRICGWVGTCQDINSQQVSVHPSTALPHSLQAVLWEADVQRTRFSSIGPEAERLLGYAVDAWTSHPCFWREHLHPDDREWVERYSLSALHERRNHELEYRMIAANGDVVWIHDLVSPLLHGDHVVGLRGVMMEVARPKGGEKNSPLSSELVRKAFSASPDLISISRMEDGRLVEVNGAFSRLLGYLRTEVIGKTCTELDLWQDDADRERLAEDMRGTGSLCDRELRLRSKDGVAKTLLASTQVIEIDDIPHVLMVGRDISERKRAEQRVRFQAKLLDLVGEAVIATDMGGTIQYWNRFAETIYGWSESEAIGASVAALLPLTDAFVAEDLIAAVVRDKMWSGEVRVRRRDRSPVHVQLTLTPIYDEQEAMIGVVGVSVDITERKKLEDDMIKVQKLESIGVLAGGIAHDFNNILTATLGNIDLARMCAQGNEEVLAALAEAEKAFWRARGLTQQLLTFAKGGTPVRRIGSVRSLIVEAANFAATGTRVRCEYAVADDLWAVEFDAGQMNQVMNNLIINAVQAMPNGGMVDIRAENVHLEKRRAPGLKKGKYVLITVTDHGIGIAREHLGKIFDPYFTTKKKGNGLGLATTYAIIRKHDGHIEVESKPGHGTRFFVYLPAIDSIPIVAEPPRALPAPGVGKILLMDDEDAVREVGGRLLRMLGYDVVLASDGAEAIRLYIEATWSAQPFSAVILDVTVPNGMGGQECMEKLRLIDPDVRAVVSSGYSNDRIMADHAKYHFCGVVAKPYQLSDLSGALQRVLLHDRLS